MPRKVTPIITIERREIVGIVTKDDDIGTPPVAAAFGVAAEYMQGHDDQEVRLEWTYGGMTFRASQEESHTGTTDTTGS